MRKFLYNQRGIFCLFAILAISYSSCKKGFEESDIPRDAVMDVSSKRVFITLKSGVVVEKVDGDYIYSGDIILSKNQLEQLDKTGSIYDENSFSTDSIGHGLPVSPVTGFVGKSTPRDYVRAVGRSPQQGMFWAMVRYTFASNLNEFQKESIREAIRVIERETNARFYDATGKPTRDPIYGFDYPYIEFNYHPSRNNSSVGRVGGKQIINLSDYVEQVIIHEICHALGMFHEQCRNDRDRYITVNYKNIEEDAHHNFRIEGRNFYRLGEFDFQSIMLYDSYSYAKDYSKPAMTKKDGTTFTGGFRLSERDKMFINRFYIPYVAREDVCVELDSIMYDGSNRRLSAEEISNIQSRMNVGRCEHMVTNPEDRWGMYW